MIFEIIITPGAGLTEMCCDDNGKKYFVRYPHYRKGRKLRPEEVRRERLDGVNSIKCRLALAYGSKHFKQFFRENTFHIHYSH